MIIKRRNVEDAQRTAFRDGPAKTSLDVIPKYKTYFNNFRQELYYDSEILYTALPCFEKFKDKKILIVGGGPSTNEIPWERIEYDYIWSLNHFFLNQKLHKRPVALATICSEVDILRPDFTDYIHKHDVILGFEVHVTLDCKKHRQRVNSFYDPNKLFCIYTRFYGKLGGAIRLAILADYLKVKELHFVGLDGPTPIRKGNHAFEKGKKTLPPSIDHLSSRQLSKYFKLQYLEFFDYMADTKMIMQNLSEIKDYNIMRDISTSRFPLRDEVKQCILAP